MAFSLFFTYANSDKDKTHFNNLSRYINPFVKSKSGELLDCENEDLLDSHAENAHVIVVLLSSEYLDYDRHPKRKKLHHKISSFIADPSKLVITVEIEDCLWLFEPAFSELEPHKLEQVDASNYGYMPIIKKIMAEINNHKSPISFKKTLHESLYRLNYDEQRLAFTSHFKELSLLNILVTGGTHECGQHLLLRTFLRFQKIDFYDEQKLVWLTANC